MRLDKKELVGIFVRAVGVAAVLTVSAMAQYGGGEEAYPILDPVGMDFT